MTLDELNTDLDKIHGILVSLSRFGFFKMFPFLDSLIVWMRADEEAKGILVYLVNNGQLLTLLMMVFKFLHPAKDAHAGTVPDVELQAKLAQLKAALGEHP